jgi:hypothetical protein
VRPFGPNRAWLSITPEPELELPAALATLREGGPPSADSVARERERVERLVTRGNRRAWRRYMADALVLAGSSEDPAVAEARAVVDEVIRNHNNLELAL